MRWSPPRAAWSRPANPDDAGGAHLKGTRTRRRSGHPRATLADSVETAYEKARRDKAWSRPVARSPRTSWRWPSSIQGRPRQRAPAPRPSSPSHRRARARYRKPRGCASSCRRRSRPGTRPSRFGRRPPAPPYRCPGLEDDATRAALGKPATGRLRWPSIARVRPLRALLRRRTRLRSAAEAQVPVTPWSPVAASAWTPRATTGRRAATCRSSLPASAVRRSLSGGRRGEGDLKSGIRS